MTCATILLALLSLFSPMVIALDPGNIEGNQKKIKTIKLPSLKNGLKILFILIEN